MVTNIDDNVGRLLRKLKEWKLEQDTMVIFMTDNGGTGGVKIFNAGMRGMKNTPYQGGTRVPFFVRWPGVTKPRDAKHLAAHIDFFPTIAEAAGATIPGDVQLDGRSLVPLLRSPEAPWPDRYLFTHVGRWDIGKAAESKYAKCRVRNTRFSMVSVGPAKKWELYDLGNDPGEKTDVSAAHPRVAAMLDTAYDRWWDDILPCLENENAVPPAENPFVALYRRQFGPG
jgi:arylsulfatase A-like enzyme